jgi:autophagy-related protein 16
MHAQLATRQAAQVEPFTSIVAAFDSLQAAHGARTDDLAAARAERDALAAQKQDADAEMARLQLAAQGLTLKTLREGELEAELRAMGGQLSKALEQANLLFAMQQELNTLREAHKGLLEGNGALEARVAEQQRQATARETTNSLLKQEHEALQMENAMQRERFAREAEENTRLLPLVMTAKQVEAELRNEIVELEQRVANMPPMGGSPTAGGGERAATYTDPTLEVSVASSVVPTYIAHTQANAHPSEIHTVCVTESGKQIWTGGTEKAVRGWDSANGQAAGKLQSPASIVCLDSKGAYLAGGCVDCTCRVWHLPTMRAHVQLTGHTEAVTTAYISADATNVFTASRDSTLKCWDLMRGALMYTSICPSSCYDLSLTTDRVCTAHFDNAIRLWDVRSGKLSGEAPGVHERAVTSVSVTSDNRHSVSLSRDNSIRVVDLRTMAVVNTFTHPAFTIQSNLARLDVSPDGSLVAAGSANGEVMVWSLRQPEKAAAVLKRGHDSGIMAVAWNTDGRGLASVGLDKKVTYWR